MPFRLEERLTTSSLLVTRPIHNGSELAIFSSFLLISAVFSLLLSVTVFLTTKPRGLQVSDLQDAATPGVKRVTFFWDPDSDQEGKEHFLCFIASDDDGYVNDILSALDSISLSF